MHAIGPVQYSPATRLLHRQGQEKTGSKMKSPDSLSSENYNAKMQHKRDWPKLPKPDGRINKNRTAE